MLQKTDHFGNCTRFQNSQEGECIPLENCKELNNLYNEMPTDEYEKYILKQSQCGDEFQRDVFVCCEIKEILPIPGSLGI